MLTIIYEKSHSHEQLREDPQKQHDSDHADEKTVDQHNGPCSRCIVAPVER